MRALNQVDAHRSETVQHPEVHGLPRPRPQAVHDRLRHSAKPQALRGATPDGEEAIGELVAVVMRILVDVSPEDQRHQ
jgi:hypothetical protein